MLNHTLTLIPFAFLKPPWVLINSFDIQKPGILTYNMFLIVAIFLNEVRLMRNLDTQFKRTCRV